jgi:predicted GH43/DUF377 family glycosyl hydrolase
LTVKVKGATTAEITWDDAISSYEGVRIYLSDDNISYTEYTTVPYGDEYCNITGLDGSKKYYLKLCAYNESLEGTPVLATIDQWWLVDGIADEDVLAVYFPVGAGSKADALKNIINPGTDDLTEEGTVSWDQAVGLYGFSDSNYLDGVTFKSHTYSIVVLADYCGTTGLRRIVSAEAAGPTGMLMVGNYEGTTGRFRAASEAGQFPVNKERILWGITQTGYFVEAVKLGAVTPEGGEVTDTLRIGNNSLTVAADQAFQGRVLAIAVYDHSLTDDQMIAIQEQMQSIGYFRDFSGLTKYAGNPIITKGAEAWRLDGASIPYVNKEWYKDGYYYAFSPVSAGSWLWNDLALFRSTDLLNWEPYGTNPVLSAVNGTWEDEFISHPCPIKIGDTFYLYYTSRDVGGVARLGRASSTDLVNWTKDGDNPLYSDPVASCYAAWINKIGSTYYLYYYRSTGANNIIHYATSADAETFTYQGTCFPTKSTANDIDYLFFELDPFVWLRKDGIYEMFYVGYKADLIQKIATAISIDGIHFHKRYKWVLEGTLNAGDWDYEVLGVPLAVEISKKQTYLYYCGAAENTPPVPSENSGGLAIIPN